MGGIGGRFFPRWTAIAFLLIAVSACRCSYLYDDCTVIEDYKGVVIKTFRDSLRVAIAKSDGDSSVTIGIKGGKTTEILDVPKRKWTEVECRVSSDEEIDCREEKFNTAENNSGGLLKKIVIRNAEVLTNCPQGLPSKELPPSTAISFPRWNSTKEHFAVIPEVNLIVALTIFGEDLVLCWDGNQTVVKTSEGDCQALPAHGVHKITLDYETQIMSSDGRILRRLNGTNANEDDLMRMRTEGGKAWVVQSLGDWPHPQDQDLSIYDQLERICNHGGNSEVIVLTVLLLFITLTIAL